MKRYLVLLAMIGSFALSTSVHAVNITFSDLVFSGFDSYEYDVDSDGSTDVRFSTIDSGGFNIVGPGPNMQLIDEPGLEGSTLNSPDLRVDFLSGAVNAISFDYAVNTYAPDGQGVKFQAFDENDKLLGEKWGSPDFTSTDLGSSSFPEGNVALGFDGVASYGLFDFQSDSDALVPANRYIIDNFSGTFGTTEVTTDDNPVEFYGVFYGMIDVVTTPVGALRGDLSAYAISNALSSVLDVPEENFHVEAFDYGRVDLQSYDILQDIKRQSLLMDENDVFIFFISSHGGTSTTGQETSVTPENEAIYLDNEYSELTDDFLTSLLDTYLPENEKIVFLDACEAGGFWAEDLENLSNIAFYAAAPEGQPASADYITGRSFFSRALESAIYVSASDGVLDLSEIDAYWKEYDTFLEQFIGLDLPIMGPTIESIGATTVFSADSWNPVSNRSQDFTGVYKTATQVAEPPIYILIFAGALTLLLVNQRRSRQ